MNAVCFNMHRTISMPVWLHDIIFKRIIPLTMFKSCLASIRKSGKCSKYAFCEGFFAASIRRKQVETTRYFEELERLNELKKYASQFSPLHAYETSTILDTHGLDEKFTANYNIMQNRHNNNNNNNSKNRNNIVDVLTNDHQPLKTQNERDVANIQHLVDKVYEDLEADACADFWRCVAQTTERLLLCLVSLLYASISIGLAYQVPRESL